MTDNRNYEIQLDLIPIPSHSRRTICLTRGDGPLNVQARTWFAVLLTPGADQREVRIHTRLISKEKKRTNTRLTKNTRKEFISNSIE